ncbi:unnamed protein product [Nippostrongylus brasiliensis]|uniref:Non-specific protein-tyrosine kinase n=1 Tax=Nippostrongylus brasiliensis TaxID=27835 RepID=A0A0N4YD14_NIPBR|nr:unnamed protein product [Nippostrongylus brasiliensis]
MVIAIRTKDAIKRIDIRRNENGIRIGVSLLEPRFLTHPVTLGCSPSNLQERLYRIAFQGKTFTNLKKLVDYYSKEPIVLQGGEELLLKKAVPKGKYQLVHSDVKLLKKIGSGAYGTVYRGLLLRENNKVIAVWRNGETRFNTDIYAYGVTIWEMFEIPYNSPYAEWKAYTVKQKVMGGYRMPPPRAMPEEIITIMELAWNHDPEKRPDAPHLRQLLEEVNKKYGGEDEREKLTLRSRAG